MIKKVLILFIFILVNKLHAQNYVIAGLDGQPASNSTEIPCVSNQYYRAIEKNCNINAARFRKTTTKNSSESHPLLSWPLRSSAGSGCDYYYISAHVDQDTNVSSFSDYNCGSITYDGHKGTDIAIAPFPFFKMDYDPVEVIAAADGIIIDRHDGEFDRNCVGASSTLISNYIVIQHSDGSRALYLHMKINSVTSKNIGDSVITGEYLGLVGSSGSSSGPHLHFEVWSESSASTVIDPFSGNCNFLSATSWWNVQKPYTEPAVLKASVNTTDLVIPPCPGTETPNESESFIIPFQGAGLPPGYAKFYIFLRNETAGTSVDMKIRNDSGTIINSWTHVCNADYLNSYWGFSKLLPSVPGEYLFEALYNGITCTQNFNISTASAIDETTIPDVIEIFPNPVSATAILRLNAPLTNNNLKIYNLYGQNMDFEMLNDTDILITRERFSNGIYFAVFITKNKILKSIKFEVNN